MDPARILYVEDDEDIRDTLTMLLEHEGYQVTALPDAALAIEELARSRFDLLLTDFQLPDRDAAWLIRTATERGVLADTPVIVLSGAHEPGGIEGYRFLHKPVSQEALLAAFDDAMPRRATPTSARPRVVTDTALRLVLYVSGDAPSARAARRNLLRVLGDVAPERVDVTVHDISAGRSWVSAAEQDRVVVVPTLVRRWPPPRVCIAGDLSDVDRVRAAVLPAELVAPGPAR